jgi:RecB family exonuclease
VDDVLKLSNSTITAYKRCARHWYLAYHLGYGKRPDRDSTTTVATLGTRVHCALEAYYGYDIDPLAALRVIYYLAVKERPFDEAELDKQHRYAKAMVEGFLQWSEEEGIDSALEVIETEHLVKRPLLLDDGAVVTLMAKLDQKVRRKTDNAVLFRDWKTVGSLTKSHLLIVDEQMRFYSLLEALSASETGERADGGLYTMLLRSMRTPKANGPFFREVEVRFNQHDHDSMLKRTKAVVTDIHVTEQKLRAGADHRAVAYPSPDPNGYCGWWCPFTLICPMMDDGSRWEDALQANFVKRDPYGYYGTGLIDQVRAALAPGKTEGK